MSTYSSRQCIKYLLRKYLSRSISLSEFNEAFAPVAWNASEKSAAELADDIEILLSEFSDDLFDETELRARLLALYGSPVMFDESASKSVSSSNSESVRISVLHGMSMTASVAAETGIRMGWESATTTTISEDDLAAV